MIERIPDYVPNQEPTVGTFYEIREDCSEFEQTNFVRWNAVIIARRSKPQSVLESTEEIIKESFFQTSRDYIHVTFQPVEGFAKQYDDHEADWADFIEYAYEHYKGEGFAISHVPDELSLAVAPWLLERTFDRFSSIRPISEKDRDKVRRKLVGRKFLDPKNLEDLHVPLTRSELKKRGLR